MRTILLFAFGAVTACSPRSGGPNAEPQTATYSAGGRDRLCIRNAGDNFPAAVIVYARSSDANCSISGRYLFVDRGPVIAARGDACQIEVKGALNSTLTLGRLAANCAYYCGPGASLDGKSFQRLPSPAPVTDLAGDPLC